MNMIASHLRASCMTFVDPLSAAPTPKTELQMAFDNFLAEQKYKRSLPIDDPRGDEAVEQMCQAMDHLINEVSAPDMTALLVKREFARERSNGFEGLFDDHPKAMLMRTRYDLLTP